MNRILPILTIVAVIIAIWYAATIRMNAQWEYDQAERAGVEISFGELVPKTMGQERPQLPAPHQVAEEIWDKFPLVRGIAMVQRIGQLEIGETTVLVACAAGHRDQGIFEAARYGIDRLKEIVPVWKKEVGPDGSVWVEGHYHPTPNDVLTTKIEVDTFACTSCAERYPIDTALYRCVCGQPDRLEHG